MTSTLKCILVAYDGFDRDEVLPALPVALAQEHGASLHVVNVIPEIPTPLWRTPRVSAAELQSALVKTREAKLRELLEPARDAGLSTGATIRTGAPHIEIIRESVSLGADLVVVTDHPTRRRGQRGFGTVTVNLLRNCPVPVLAERDSAKDKYEKILAAVDVAEPLEESHPNARVMQLAATFAEHAGAKVTAFHAWTLWGERLLASRARLEEADISELLAHTKQSRRDEVDELVASSPLKDAHVELIKGEARDVLPRYVAKYDIELVVMGTLGRAGLRGLLIGNTAERILNELSCSVLAVKPDDFVCPVSAKSGADT